MPIIMVPKDREDELMHYGVLGMKWGVRKGRTSEQYQNEYKKANKKLGKLDRKYDKSERRVMDAQSYADKKLASIFASKETKRQALMELKEARAVLYKRARKGHKWINNMEKSFSKVNIELTKDDRELGKKYMETMRLYAMR